MRRTNCAQEQLLLRLLRDPADGESEMRNGETTSDIFLWVAVSVQQFIQMLSNAFGYFFKKDVDAFEFRKFIGSSKMSEVNVARTTGRNKFFKTCGTPKKIFQNLFRTFQI